MSERINNIPVISQENKQQCDFCGKIKELRPYGPKGECICFSCAMKDEKTTRKQFARIIMNEDAPAE
jgi:hypothetical protein